MSFYYDMDGNPITRDEWAGGFSQTEDRRIAKTTLPGGVWVSTVWLGLDHRFGGEGPPLIFETMIFEGPLDGYEWRSSTREQAMAGHAHAVRQAWLYWLFPTVMGWLRRWPDTYPQAYS